jgi:hypothetical protein
MSRRLKPFTELPLKLLAIDTIANSNVLLQVSAVIPQATFPGAAVPFEHLMERPRDPIAGAGGWHHGGINE